MAVHSMRCLTLLTKVNLHFQSRISITEALAVNVIAGNASNDDRKTFRQYESACDRVQKFYREQHGLSAWIEPHYFTHQVNRKADRRIQHTGSYRFQDEEACSYERLGSYRIARHFSR
jgi:P2-related tail formation protein